MNNKNDYSQRARLQNIARNAMLDKGFPGRFSAGSHDVPQ